MDAIDLKIKRFFGEYAVDKKLARSGNIPRIPTFIKEYMITRNCSQPSAECIESIARLVRELHPDPASRERFLGKPKEEGQVQCSRQP